MRRSLLACLLCAMIPLADSNALHATTCDERFLMNLRTSPKMLDEGNISYSSNNRETGSRGCDKDEQHSFCQRSRLYSWLIDMVDRQGERVHRILNYGGDDDDDDLYGFDAQKTNSSSSLGSADCMSYTGRLIPSGCHGIISNADFVHGVLQSLDHPGTNKTCTLSDFDLKDMADVVIVKNLPNEVFAGGHGDSERLVRENLLIELNINVQHVTIMQSKICDTLYPEVRCEPRMAVRLTTQHKRQVTSIISKLLDQEKRYEISYKDLFDKLYHIPLIKDLPLDKTRLEEVSTGDFYGIQRNLAADSATAKLLSSTHVVVVISLRKLAPVVHEMLSGPITIYPSPPSTPDRKRHDGVLVDHEFLMKLQGKLEKAYGRDTLSVAPGSEGTNYYSEDGQPKPLEYLITCVPGIEVFYDSGDKYIRKMDLNERNNISLDTESLGSPVPLKMGHTQTGNNSGNGNTNNNTDDPIKKLVQTITAILKMAQYQYMTIPELDEELRKVTDLHADFTLRDFITEHVKFHQLLTLGEPELVMLSHRAQIKRISNDMQKVLRRLTPRFVNTNTLPSAFMDLWENCDNAASRPNGDRSAKFSVSRYGVCFLDDIMVTIPQNWGIHCSTYISNSDGRLIVRNRGDGEEDVPSFVKLPTRLPTGYPESGNNMSFFAGFGDSGNSDDSMKTETSSGSQVEYTTVYAWAPRSRISDNQQRNLAIFRQQLLNMYRGDPTAVRVKEISENWEPRYGNENERLKRLDTACLRANLEQPPRMKRPGDKTKPESDAEHRHHVPCDFKLHFNQFIPTFHHVYNAQATVSRYGVKTLFEAFELMSHTIKLSHAEAQAAMIQLTPEARREIMERRLIYLMRNCNGLVDYNRLISMYMSQPTMRVYANPKHIEEAIQRCTLFNTKPISGGNWCISVKPRFCLSLAISHFGKDIGHLLTIFMRSFTWLSFGDLHRLFQERYNRVLPVTAFRNLLDLGAIRYPLCSPTTPENTLFDLQDDCRVVRNLIHQMNSKPDATYLVYDPRNDTNRIVYGARDERSITFLLECSGDCMYADFDVDAMMKDFSEFFVLIPNSDRRVRSAYKLHQSVIVGVPDGDEQDHLQVSYRRAFRPRTLSFNSVTANTSQRANNNNTNSNNTSHSGRPSNRQQQSIRSR
ncbi:uncharacterized protein LOC111253396 isoform X2 [Varroa destructor]|uniref:Uncharacterized protein n=1 Tax=Varroa destructor TaxID=109461 RepID=A0A7M7KKU4_VARDE|nr:uncharacterized protein LOC111253396 isoform X2 [Varroa destructor]